MDISGISSVAPRTASHTGDVGSQHTTCSWRNSMKTPRLVLGTILAAGVLLAGGVSGVMAAHGGGGRAGGPAGGAIAFGRLASLSAGSATITTPGSASTTVTVTLASAATCTARSQAAAVA